MTKHLKDMSIEELQAGYEKGKVTDEEIEQHLLEQIHRNIKKSVSIAISKGGNKVNCKYYAYWYSEILILKLAEHEYQKLKDND